MSLRAPKLLGDTRARVSCQHYVLMRMSHGVGSERGRERTQTKSWKRLAHIARRGVPSLCFLKYFEKVSAHQNQPVGPSPPTICYGVYEQQIWIWNFCYQVLKRIYFARRLQHKLLKVRIESRMEIVLEFRPLTTRTSIESNLMYLFRADMIKSGFIFITLRLSCKVPCETWPRRPSMNHSHLSPSTWTSLTPGPSPWLIAVLWHAWPIGSPGSDHTRLDFDPRAGGEAAALLWLQRARIVL